MKTYTKSVIIIIILCLLGVFDVNFATSDDMRPEDLKVKGFFIGMTKDEALNNAAKLGWKIDHTPFDDKSRITFIIKEKHPIEKDAIISIQNNIVTEVYLNFTVFNANDMPFEEFAQNFINNYNIPRMTNDFPYYKYQNSNGLSITLYCRSAGRGVYIKKINAYDKTKFD